MADEYDDIELYAQFNNTYYINSNIASDDDTISEEEIQNGTGYEFEDEADDDAVSAL